MRAVIITGGMIKDYNYIKQYIRGGDTIICADSGYNHMVKMCLDAEVIVGDFDSIGKIPENVPIIQYPPEKDLTDTEIAIEYAREKGFHDFLILAGTGTRMDHTLSNIFMLKGFLDRGETAQLIDEHNKIMMTNRSLRLNEKEGSIVSLIPLCECRGITTRNLQYHLNDETLYFGHGRGISNVMLEDEAQVTLKSGLLLIIVARD